MISFRKKILLSYLAILVLFIGIMYPIATETVKNIVYNSLYDRTWELIEKIQEAPNNEQLVQRLKDQKFLMFFRISLITNERKVLYDSYNKHSLDPHFDKELAVVHPEVEDAFEYGEGYYEGFSNLLEQKLAYFAMSFDFQGKTYVLRTAFPFQFVVDMTHDFEVGFITLSIAILLLFSFMAWFIIQHLTRPIHQIITAVRPYQSGEISTLPEIRIDAAPQDDFGKLASTLNSLSEKIQSHINSLMHERNEKEAVLESLVEGVIAVDENMIVTYANHTALKLLKKEINLIGQNFSILNQSLCFNLLQRCHKEKIPLTDNIELYSSDIKVYLDVVAAPQKNNAGAVLVMEDKSTHYKLLEMRKDFIANASHELKTPITIIRGFAETLHDHPDLPHETKTSITGKIVHNCKRMTVLIKDLLTLSDIENIPESRLIECDLVNLIENCADTIRHVSPEMILSIEIPQNETLSILADPSLIELAVTNLLENAVKYSPSTPNIKIILEKVDSNIKLSIADKGIGIPTADLEHIFERFYTVNKAHSRKLGGSGLGLSIVKTIIEKHFGKISAASTLGEGTTFTMVFPAIAAEAAMSS